MGATDLQPLIIRAALCHDVLLQRVQAIHLFLHFNTRSAALRRIKLLGKVCARRSAGLLAETCMHIEAKLPEDLPLQGCKSQAHLYVIHNSLQGSPIAGLCLLMQMIQVHMCWNWYLHKTTAGAEPCHDIRYCFSAA